MDANQRELERGRDELKRRSVSVDACEKRSSRKKAQRTQKREDGFLGLDEAKRGVREGAEEDAEIETRVGRIRPGPPCCPPHGGAAARRTGRGRLASGGRGEVGGLHSVKLPDFDNFHTWVGIQCSDSINSVTKLGTDLIRRCVAAS